MSHEMPLMQEYIGQAAATKFKLVESNSSQVGDIPSQQIRLLIDEDDVEISGQNVLRMLISNDADDLSRRSSA